ncbi:MAG: hypothetical protein HYV13_00210 [Candidatus Doudnabacteria bacterium]|nr:hypothetical protein [Candidatus Doudnabacteria bacterium]
MGKRVRERHFSVIGMSNHGKSHWSELLAALGYRWISIDKRIAERLRPELETKGLTVDTDGVAAWMGMPWDEGFESNQARYLQLEEELTREALLTLDPGTPTVIDTTGSVVHLSGELLTLLIELTVVILVDSDDNRDAEGVALYLSKPKPVALVSFWDSSWNTLGEEDRMAHLKTAIAGLRKLRASIYRGIAHVILPYAQHHESGWTVSEFIAAIESQTA